MGANPFVLKTNTSAMGLETVLEQDNKVIAYASRSSSKSECNYSTIQKECLAFVFTTKQFCHYLLGRPFTVMTDHAPLQWLALQEYTFKIVHHKGTLNDNADALSCPPHPVTAPLPVAVTTTTEPTTALRQAQLEDPILQQVQQALLHEKPSISSWHHSLLRRYLQLWHQLSNVDRVVCHMYQPGATSDVVKVSLIPTSLQQNALQQSHVGHQGSYCQDIRLIAARGILGWNDKEYPTLLSAMHNMSTS